MNLNKALEILKIHQQWRRGADINPPSPKEVGQSIDLIISFTENEQSRNNTHTRIINHLIQTMETQAEIVNKFLKLQSEFYNIDNV